MKKAQIKQSDLHNRLNKTHVDTVKRLEDQDDELKQKKADLVEKNSLIKSLEEEVKEYKVIVQEYKGKLNQIEDHHRRNMEDTEIPEKKRKTAIRRESSTSTEQSSTREGRSSSRENKEKTKPLQTGG